MTPTGPLDLLDTDALLGEVAIDVRSVVREFADSLRPNVAGWYEKHTLPVREIAKQMGDLGLFGMQLPEFGGAEPVSYGVACMELEAVDSGLRSLLSVQGSLAMHAIAEFGSDHHKREWLPRLAAGEAIGCFGLTEADFGSNPSGMRTRAERSGPDWVLNGSKAWITNGSAADVAIVWAQTEAGVRGFVVPNDSPGFSARPVGDKLSLRASDTSELSLVNVRLPDSAVLPGSEGLKSALACLNEARFGIVWGVLGAARDCLTTAIEYAGERVQFDRAISGFQLTQMKFAEMTATLNTGLLMAVRISQLKAEGGLAPAAISLAKFNNVRGALDIARESRTVLGAAGISGLYPIMRHMANLESVLTYEGTHEIHALAVGQALTGISAYRG